MGANEFILQKKSKFCLGWAWERDGAWGMHTTTFSVPTHSHLESGVGRRWLIEIWRPRTPWTHAVCVCMVCACAHVCQHACKHMHISTWVCTHACMQVYASVHTCADVDLYAHTCACACKVCVHVYMHKHCGASYNHSQLAPEKSRPSQRDRELGLFWGSFQVAYVTVWKRWHTTH